MKLLLDENLSPRLIPRLLSLFADLTHVRDVGLKQADDNEIWRWAKANFRISEFDKNDKAVLVLRLAGKR